MQTLYTLSDFSTPLWEWARVLSNPLQEVLSWLYFFLSDFRCPMPTGPIFGFNSNSFQGTSLDEAISLRAQINKFKLQSISLKDMARPKCISIHVRLVMWMKQPGLVTVENRVHSGWIRQPEDSPSVSQSVLCSCKISAQHIPNRRGDSLGWLAGSTDNGNTLRHHNLISAMCMQVSAAHEACLSWVRMDPTQHHQIFSGTVVEKCTFVNSVTRIACALLLRNHHLRNKQRVGD